MTNYCINTKHIRNTSSKKDIKGSNDKNNNLRFEDKAFLRGGKCYNNKIAINKQLFLIVINNIKI